MKLITYYFNEDIVYIFLSGEESVIGNEDFQEGVILLRDEDDNIVGIEIMDFTDFKEDKIKASEEECWDFSKAFRELRMFISLRDIMFSSEEKDRKEFEETCKVWGIQAFKINNDSKRSPSFSIRIEDVPLLDAASCCY